MTTSATVFVGIGGNLGDRGEHLQAAVAGLTATPGVSVTAVSRVYETRAVGPSSRPFFNACVRLACSLSPLELLDACLDLERARGRIRGERWGARTLDVDLLAWIDADGTHRRLTTTRLTLPHPRAAERDFVLAPLADIAGARPILGEGSVGELLARVPSEARTVRGAVDVRLGVEASP